MKTILGSLGSTPSPDIFRAELGAIGDIQSQLSYFIQDTIKNFSFCNKNIKSGKAWFLESINSRKDLATIHLLFALGRYVAFPLRTPRSCRTLYKNHSCCPWLGHCKWRNEHWAGWEENPRQNNSKYKDAWTRADLAHVREVAGRPVWLERREKWESTGVKTSAIAGVESSVNVGLGLCSVSVGSLKRIWVFLWPMRTLKDSEQWRSTIWQI